jgi:hypothetical protein
MARAYRALGHSCRALPGQPDSVRPTRFGFPGLSIEVRPSRGWRRGRLQSESDNRVCPRLLQADDRGARGAEVPPARVQNEVSAEAAVDVVQSTSEPGSQVPRRLWTTRVPGRRCPLWVNGVTFAIIFVRAGAARAAVAPKKIIRQADAPTAATVSAAAAPPCLTHSTLLPASPHGIRKTAQLSAGPVLRNDP